MVSFPEQDTTSTPCAFGITWIAVTTAAAVRSAEVVDFGDDVLAARVVIGGVIGEVGSASVSSLLLLRGERVYGLARSVNGVPVVDDEAPVEGRQPSASRNTARGREGDRGR